MSHATERIQEIIDTAERVAEEIRRDAETEAERYLSDRRREADRFAAEQGERLEAALAGLRGHLTRVETEGGRLLAELERALAELTGPRAGAQGPGPPTERARPDQPAGHRGNAHEPEAAPPSTRSRTHLPGELRDTALIRATQMAVRGSDRAEIEAALRDELGIADPAPLVEQVIGG